MDKASKSSKPGSENPAAPRNPSPEPAPGRVPPLFRRIDWFTLAFTFVVVWIVYFLTLAPEQTLEDSGELCTGAFYAGIPHPPGYPFWTIYAWLWTKLLPFGNVAWRVEVGQSTAAAMACGLVAFMVSRGSSMLIEGIEELKNMTGKWENAICMVSGIAAGLLLGFGGVMWSESVAINRISLFGVPWVMIVLLCLLRWIYAPRQWIYLFCGLFFFGVCATIHQTLLVAAMGIEVAIAIAHPRLGRHIVLWNTILFLAGLVLNQEGYVTMLNTANMVLIIYFAVGICSIVSYVWLCVRTKITMRELGMDGALFAGLLLLASAPTLGMLAKLLGPAALATHVWLGWQLRKLGKEWLIVPALGLLWILGASFYLYEPIAGMTNPPMQWGYPRTVEGFFHALSRGQYEKANPTDLFAAGGVDRFVTQLGMMVSDIAVEFNWVVVFVALVPLLFLFKVQRRERAWLLGLTGVYFCIGVILVILMNPTPERQSADLVKVFFTSSHGVVAILFGYGLALTAAYMATHYRQFRIAGLTLGGILIVPALMTLYNGVNMTFHGGATSVPPRNWLSLFLCMTGCLVATALAVRSYIRRSNIPAGQEDDEFPVLIAYASLAVLCLGGSVFFAFFTRGNLHVADVVTAIGRIFAPNQYSLPVIGGLLICAVVGGFVASLLVYRRRAPLAITLGLIMVMPFASALAHWGSSEQRDHWFGYWFGHDMFTPPFNGADGKPIYPEMAKDTILFGGTDPGRFNPTYMIFCESFIPHDCQPKQDQNFDRRDVYLITQNALADGTYLNYLRAQYFRSQQIDPPFFSELVRTVLKDKDYQTNILARMVSPLDTYFIARGERIERRWRTYTSWFTPAALTNLPALKSRLQPGPQQDPVSAWLYQNCSKETQNLIAGPADARLAEALAQDFNLLLDRELEVRQQIGLVQRDLDSVNQQLLEGDNSDRLQRRKEQLTKDLAALKVDPLYDKARFAQVQISPYLQQFIAQNPQGDTRIRLNRLLLEAAYPGDITRSIGGVYPDREIYIPSPEDSQACFNAYLEDAHARFMHDNDPKYRNEARQLKPGEGVQVDPESHRVSVNGQVAVMAINGYLTKVIFDRNPINEFYVEESFPLDWMFPHLTPFGIIMKINRQPVPEITDDMVRRDHDFWTQYSTRLTGNWLTYETPIKDVVRWIEQVYLRRDFTGFTGDRRFIRDDQAQKSFSKLRSSIGGVYAWRLGMLTGVPTPPQYFPKTQAERERLLKEADFAFKQAFAFCPYSPEAVWRYVWLLIGSGRLEDALLVADTCRRLDPENGAIVNMIDQLNRMKSQPDLISATQEEIQTLNQQFKSNPDDFQKGFDLASKYMQIHEPDHATQVLESMLNNPHASVDVIMSLVRAFAEMNDVNHLAMALEKVVQIDPNQPEAWYDLGFTKLAQGKPADALQCLKRAMDLNTQRLAQNPKAHDLRQELDKDARFAGLRNTPQFKELFPPR
ncbi:MAG: DUF2723 domain-containing protein [Verrucomicrobiota bacterium]